MKPLLEATDIVKDYGTYRALDKVSVSFPEGCIFGLLGPNGAGKTTLIRIITQITAPDEGTLRFKGEPLSRDHIYHVGYLPEERGLYKKMKVGEQAMYLAQLKGLSQSEAKDRLHKWFKRFEITSWWDKKVEDLSKGMAQKVQFITTVLHEPKFLILDEPFSGFDPINAELIKNEILELKKRGTTIVLSTHNMSSVEEICDHIALINKSRKLLGGDVLEIRDRYRTHTFRVDFTGDAQSLHQLDGSLFQLKNTVQQKRFQSATIQINEQTKLNQLLAALNPLVELHGVEEIIPTMNDIFIQAVSNDIRQN